MSNPPDPTTRVRALLARLRPIIQKAPTGPWQAFDSGTGVVAVRRGREDIIAWTGFDSSALPLAERGALAKHIAALDRETCLQLLDCLAAAVELAEATTAMIEHDDTAGARAVAAAFAGPQPEPCGEEDDEPCRFHVSYDKALAAWTAAAGRVGP